MSDPLAHLSRFAYPKTFVPLHPPLTFYHQHIEIDAPKGQACLNEEVGLELALFLQTLSLKRVWRLAK